MRFQHFCCTMENAERRAWAQLPGTHQSEGLRGLTAQAWRISYALLGAIVEIVVQESNNFFTDRLEPAPSGMTSGFRFSTFDAVFISWRKKHMVKKFCWRCSHTLHKKF